MLVPILSLIDEQGSIDSNFKTIFATHPASLDNFPSLTLGVAPIVSIMESTIFGLYNGFSSNDDIIDFKVYRIFLL